VLPSIQHADEVYQVAEQANRADHGYGIVPWEFRMASRAVVLPTLVRPIYLINASAETHQFLVAALFCALSLIPVWVAFHWAARLYGLSGGVLAATMMGTWFELVYFAQKPTADAVCSYFLLAAIFLARPAARAGAVFVAGCCLMLALGIRVQIAPAVGLALLLAFLIGGRSRRMALVAGVAAGLAVVGVIEWAWWGVPFRGQWGYLAMEFTYGASRFFAHEPVTFFAKEYVLMYGGALPLMAFLIYIGAKKAPVLLLTAIALIAPFHLIGHKEYRFVVAAVPVWVLLVSLGAAELMARIERTATLKTRSIILGGWLVAMVCLSFGDHFRPMWTQSRNNVLAFREVGTQPDACGIGLVSIRWSQTPGYSGLGRDIPIYEVAPGQTADFAAAANYLLLAPKAAIPPDPYIRWKEYARPTQYLYRRPGECVPNPAAQIIRPPGVPGLPESAGEPVPPVK
jgi:hypothetical protein